MVKNLVTVILVAVSATESTVWAFDTSSERFFAELLVDGLELGVRQNFECLANELEFWLIHLHLL